VKPREEEVAEDVEAAMEEDAEEAAVNETEPPEEATEAKVLRLRLSSATPTG
jgi:hypothetical protein